MAAATRNEIRDWLNKAKECGTSHVIVVRDLLNMEDYPVFVRSKQSLEAKFRKHNENMQRVLEVYSMRLDLESQLQERRAVHFE